MLTHSPDAPQLAMAEQGLTPVSIVNTPNLFQTLIPMYHLGVPLMRVSEVNSHFSFILNISFLLLFLNNSLGKYTILADLFSIST